MSATDILHELRSFARTGSVLYVAAHPDDENTRLIAYLARGRGYRTGYLSLTRGDGGQNLIGPELGEQLGLIRTHELLAARQVDGGEQFFTRAKDFGFSKDYRETLAIWDREQVLADMVRVIRTFRPDVIVTRFSPEPGTTHGHHTASARLAVEAFHLAADPDAFADELGELPAWQGTRVVWNVFSAAFGRASGAADDSAMLRLDVGGYDPLTGRSFGEIAARSRSLHKSQGFGTVGTRGPAWEHFRLLAGEPARDDLMDGVDTSWRRVPRGAELARQAEAVLAEFDPQDPAASVPALLELREQFERLADLPPSQPTGPELAKRRQLDRILQACLGLYVDSLTPESEVVAGEPLPLQHTAVLRTNFPVRWVATRYPAAEEAAAREVMVGETLAFNQPVTREVAASVPGALRPGQPYWLVEAGSDGMFAVTEGEWIGRPLSPPVFPVEHVFEVGGQTLLVADEPLHRIDDPVEGEVRRPLVVIPPVTLRFAEDLALFAPGETRMVALVLEATRVAAGEVALEAPPGWGLEPARQRFALGRVGARERVEFAVTAPDRPAEARLAARAEVGGAEYHHDRVELRYPHIPRQVLQPPATLAVVSLELAILGREVGYLPGAGDRVPEAIARMGYRVTTLEPADLTAERLRSLDAVVLGIRAFNTRPDLVPRLGTLWAYAAAGGVVVVQYNTTADLRSPELGPYPLTLSRDRVTDERAAVTLLAPEHPALVGPNLITAADFNGWVQERGLYFPSRWDERYTPLLGMSDPDETAKQGSLLVARHGEGYVVYTGLSWFRQLPAGVPGAYRLFANLLSLGK